MHRGLQFAGAHGLADFGDEGAALAAMAQQLAGLVLIAAGFEPDDLDVQPRIRRQRSSRATSSVCASAIALLRVPMRQGSVGARGLRFEAVYGRGLKRRGP